MGVLRKKNKYTQHKSKKNFPFGLEIDINEVDLFSKEKCPFSHSFNEHVLSTQDGKSPWQLLVIQRRKRHSPGPRGA